MPAARAPQSPPRQSTANLHIPDGRLQFSNHPRPPSPPFQTWQPTSSITFLIADTPPTLAPATARAQCTLTLSRVGTPAPPQPAYARPHMVTARRTTSPPRRRRLRLLAIRHPKCVIHSPPQGCASPSRLGVFQVPAPVTGQHLHGSNPRDARDAGDIDAGARARAQTTLPVLRAFPSAPRPCLHAAATLHPPFLRALIERD